MWGRGVKTRFYRPSTPKIYSLLTTLSIRPNVVIVPLESKTGVKLAKHIPTNRFRNNLAS